MTGSSDSQPSQIHRKLHDVAVLLGEAATLPIEMENVDHTWNELVPQIFPEHGTEPCFISFRNLTNLTALGVGLKIRSLCIKIDAGTYSSNVIFTLQPVPIQISAPGTFLSNGTLGCNLLWNVTPGTNLLYRSTSNDRTHFVPIFGILEVTLHLL